jgi:gluconokinase
LIIVVMGVSGAGKSTLGRALAASLAWDFVEGDDYHPMVNIEKMRGGIPLNDEDRLPWLQALQDFLQRCEAEGKDMVLACSALKKDYRDLLAASAADIRFVYLSGERSLIRDRLKARQHHFMLPELLDSQLAALEPPRDAVPVPVQLSTRKQVDLLRKSLGV